MRIETSDDLLDLLEAAPVAAALGAALEMDLFGLLGRAPLPSGEIAAALGVDPVRCGYWLQMLQHAGLLECAGGWSATPAVRGLLAPLSGGSWAMLAEEARERRPRFDDLRSRLRGVPPAVPDDRPYVSRMKHDPARARRFTRMLFDVHRELADAVASAIDLRGILRVVDIGGGSGVVSAALVRREPRVHATVLDIGPVCAAGREIAAAAGLADRFTFHACDFLNDALPAGFDLAVECDVGVYSERLFDRVREALAPEGRFVVVDQFAPAPGIAPRARVHWALEESLDDPAFRFDTAATVRGWLESSGFEVTGERTLSFAGGESRFTRDTTLIEARSKRCPDMARTRGQHVRR